MAAEERLYRTDEEGMALGEEEWCSAQEVNDELSAAFMSAELAAVSGWLPTHGGARVLGKGGSERAGVTGWSKACRELGDVLEEYQPVT